MSDHLDAYDEVFRSKLSDHAVSPPESVWDNIEAKRDFGHIVANKISINWRTFGTMLLLLLGGGSSAILFGGEEQVNERSGDAVVNQLSTGDLDNHTSLKASSIDKKETKNYHYSPRIKASKPEQVFEENTALPAIELMASIEQAAFTKPFIYQDPQLNALIQSIDGWESAKPTSFVRYYSLNQIPQHGLIRSKLNQDIRLAEQLEYDYVKEEITKKSFWDRSSIYLAFTPLSIRKTMQANYNLSSSYLRARQNSEKTRMAYSIEALLHYKLKNNKFIESGLNFTRMFEEMSFMGERQFSNQYDFIEIPLLLGYEDRNAKWGYQIKGGFGVQVMNHIQGYIYKVYEENGVEPQTPTNPQHRVKSGGVMNLISSDHSLGKNQDPNEVLDLSDPNQNPYKSAGVINMHLSAGLTYYHSIKTSFVIAPYFRRSVTSITKESALFKERITYTGISLGTRIKF